MAWLWAHIEDLSAIAASYSPSNPVVNSKFGVVWLSETGRLFPKHGESAVGWSVECRLVIAYPLLRFIWFILDSEMSGKLVRIP